MSTRTLKKVLEELKADTPDISYIRGMIEVLVEEDSPATLAGPVANALGGGILSPKVMHNVDEEEIIPEALKPGRIGKLA